MVVPMTINDISKVNIRYLWIFNCKNSLIFSWRALVWGNKVINAYVFFSTFNANVDEHINHHT